MNITNYVHNVLFYITHEMILKDIQESWGMNITAIKIMKSIFFTILSISIKISNRLNK